MRVYDIDRVCSHPDCTTRLSRYNGGKLCWCHQEPTAPRTRGRPARSAA